MLVANKKEKKNAIESKLLPELNCQNNMTYKLTLKLANKLYYFISSTNDFIFYQKF